MSIRVGIKSSQISEKIMTKLGSLGIEIVSEEDELKQLVPTKNGGNDEINLEESNKTLDNEELHKEFYTSEFIIVKTRIITYNEIVDIYFQL